MKLEISQTQKQMISPVILQTFELLTMPAIELAERLVEEAEINPVLELEYNKPNIKYSLTPDEETEHKFQDSSDPGYEPPVRRTREYSDYNNKAYIENLSLENIDLYDYIFEQVHYLPFSPREREIAEIIVTSIDSKGFLSIPLEQLIQNTDYTLAEFEKVRQQILKLDPLGVASRNLEEFLAIQSEQKFGKESLEFQIISRYIALLEKKYYSKIAKKLNVNFEDIQRAVENIKTLNITPASNFSSDTTKYIIPDARVDVNENRIQIVLNDEYIPNIKLNQYYLDLYSNVEDKSTKEFLKNNIERAKILIENLRSRKEIIFKVILKIIEKQRDYFLKGEKFQLPLKLKDIADELDIHESTVSRAIKNKYIQTEKGIISLKQFFSTNVGSEDISSKSIKEIIKKIIDAEDRNVPLSDQMIVRILKNKGIIVSRRTVAKYRSELNIPAAYIRRNPI